MLLPLEQLVNKILGMDPVTRSSLTRFDGCVLEVVSRAPATKTFLVFDSDRVRLRCVWDGHADAMVAGSSAALIRQLFTASQSRSLVNPAIEIRGDSELVQDFYRLLGNLDPDWLGPLGLLLGDAAAHQAGDIAARASDFGRKSSRRFKENLDDYLHEESGLLPAAGEFESFDNRLDAVRLYLDRLDARLQVIQRRLEATPDPD